MTNTIRHVAVIDIGKTNAKVALVDLDSLSEVALRRTPNTVSARGIYPHHDIDRLWAFILDSLASLHDECGIDAISVTTHGATAALLDRDCNLALPVLDYEHDGPDELRSVYAAVRPAFEQTGSPAFPVGLNIGSQLFWQRRSFPTEFAHVAAILMYPQYWSFRLTGVMASEVTSLGCHTDLWAPEARDYSSLVDRMGWRPLFAPLRKAGDVLRPILPEIADRTGLDPATPVVCGIHDSNASLLPHLVSRDSPFVVVSTGTWVVSMAVGGRRIALDPGRDTLLNVNAFGDPVPSARFMGGREFELLGGGGMPLATRADVERVLAAKTMLLPSVQPGSGPFPNMVMRWVGEAAEEERAAAVSFYLAMMTATCLDLADAQGETIVEGPFAANELFVGMLAAATGRAVVAGAGQGTGTSLGAALLANQAAFKPAASRAKIRSPGVDWETYARAWREAAESPRQT